MIKTIETTGKTEEEAVAAALSELGVSRDEVSVEILERAKSGFLGIGAVQAKVRVSCEVPDPEPEPMSDGHAEKAERFLAGLMEHMGVAAEKTSRRTRISTMSIRTKTSRKMKRIKAL